MIDPSWILGWIVIALTLIAVTIAILQIHISNRPRRNLGQHVQRRRR